VRTATRNTGTCRFEWCERPASAKGYCKTCYARLWAQKKAASDTAALERKRAANRKWAAGRPLREVTVAEKCCGGCKVTKPAAEFYRQRQGGDGLQAICITCSQAAQREIALARRCKNVGITVDQYNALWERQAGLCGLCTRPATDLDHCHDTGKFRGLLCAACNRILGTVQDDAALLRRLADYVDNRGLPL
jgi:hypothetical protein